MIAYLDLPSGLSGDMMLGCLVDCGFDPAQIRQTIEALRIPNEKWAVQVAQVMKGALRATRVDVLAEEGKSQRRLGDIVAMLEASSLPPSVRDRATRVFTRLAKAEAKVHGTTADRIHFHEVGAMDAIIDIVASIAGLHALKIDTLYASAVPLGHGWIDSSHGRLPLPAPATLELLAAARAPTVPAPGPGELLTPTGAALLAELATFEMPQMTLSRVGLGAGQRECPWPNVARMWLGEAGGDGAMCQLETNIDDMNPQLYCDVSEKLFAAGARDVWLTPVQMKKGRPGVVLSVIAGARDEAALAGIILRHTTSLGVRVKALTHRHTARREIRQIATRFGEIHVKVKWLNDEPIDAVPEYDDCKLLADRAGASILSVQRATIVVAQALLDELRSVR